MFIPDPDFYPSRIPDLGSRIQQQQKRRGKNLLSHLFVAKNRTKLEKLFILQQELKKYLKKQNS
jgi:hypothetical protein